MMMGGESSISQAWASRLLRNPHSGSDAAAPTETPVAAFVSTWESSRDAESGESEKALTEDDQKTESHDQDAHAEGEHAGDEHAGDEHHGEHDYLDQGHLLQHVEDAPHFEYSGWLFGDFKNGTKHLEIPQPLMMDKPIMGREGSTLLPFDLKVTKYMVIEVLVAIALVAVFVPLARKIRTGAAPKGKIWNLLEVLIVYVRDQVARPSIGKHDADKYMPFLWTIFFFVLFCNLFGLIPFLGSPTGALGVTSVLALATFGVVLWTGISKLGFIGFFKAQVPHMDLPIALAIFIVPMIFLIEVLGLFMKHFVLALRLFANMFAGHLVLAVLLALIGTVWGQGLVYLVAPASIFASIGVNLLELFVAFLQAYIFTFLSALFIGAAAHPH